MPETNNPTDLNPDDLNPTDRAILAQLHEHPMTPGYIAQRTNYSNGNVANRLQYLKTHDHVEPMGGGMWRLRSDPRSDE